MWHKVIHGSSLLFQLAAMHFAKVSDNNTIARKQFQTYRILFGSTSLYGKDLPQLNARETRQKLSALALFEDPNNWLFGEQM
jgi:type II secretory pathway component PulJ